MSENLVMINGNRVTEKAHDTKDPLTQRRSQIKIRQINIKQAKKQYLIMRESVHSLRIIIVYLI